MVGHTQKVFSTTPRQINIKEFYYYLYKSILSDNIANKNEAEMVLTLQQC